MSDNDSFRQKDGLITGVWVNSAGQFAITLPKSLVFINQMWSELESWSKRTGLKWEIMNCPVDTAVFTCGVMASAGLSQICASAPSPWSQHGWTVWSRLHIQFLSCTQLYAPGTLAGQAMVVPHNQRTNKHPVLKFNTLPKKCSGSWKLKIHTLCLLLCWLPLTMQGSVRSVIEGRLQVSAWAKVEFMTYEEGAGHCKAKLGVWNLP